MKSVCEYNVFDELLTDMHRLGIKLWAEGDRLRYDAPQGAMTPSVIAALKAHKAELLQVLSQLADQGPNERIQAIPRDGHLPLSFAQERVWLHSQLDASGIVYNLPAAWQLRGQLDRAALGQSLTEIVRRHESLRTIFTTVNGQPKQVIQPPQDMPLPLHDLRPSSSNTMYSQDQQQSEIHPIAVAEGQQAFDLTTGPLFRAQLLQVADEDHILLLTLHHIVADGWSVGILAQELTALYAAYLVGETVGGEGLSVNGAAGPLPELPLQYADFAHWQRQQMQGAALKRHLDYWRRQLADAPTVIDLPTDHPRPAQQAYQGDTMTFQLDAHLTAQLKALSQAHQATLYMTLLAAFNILLHRYTGQTDILIGTPIANRQREELETLIGFFANTLVLRSKLDDDPSFTDLLRQVRQTTITAYEHQDLPFEKLIEDLSLERDPSRNPLIQILFALQNAPAPPFVLSGLEIEQIDLDVQAVKWDLALHFWEIPEGLHGYCEYNTDLFEAATIARLLKHLQILLAGIVAAPHEAISRQPLLSEAEKQQMLLVWNQPSAMLTDQNEIRRREAVCIHQLIAQQAADRPEAIAVRFENQTLTYQALSQQADQLAQQLGDLAFDQNSSSEKLGQCNALVGLCVERSLEMIVGLLGILKAGAAYVPLDPALPQERLAYMVQDAQLAALVTQSSLVDKVPEVGQTVCVDDALAPSAPKRGKQKNGPLWGVRGAETANQLVYVIYTSGSTGQPKGVAVEHRQLFHYVNDIQKALDLPAGVSFGTVSTLAADLGNTAIFPALCTGGTVVILSQAQIADPERLANDLAQQPLDCLKITPSHLKALLSASEPGRVLPKQRLVLGGEALTWDLVETVQALAPQCRIFNHYGPTESTIGVLTCPISEIKQTGRPPKPPLGRPLAQTQVYVLDTYHNPVPVGVPGELYIGGAQVARGYLHRPDLTAERFITPETLPFDLDPSFRQAGGKLYKTGDLVRYLPDGQLEFLGRADDQIKLRGFRIELGEIEAALSHSAAVREAVVVEYMDARHQEGEVRQLIAYLVPEQPDLDLKKLREELSQGLPEYMLPAKFVLMQAIPLTANGKVDRKALPQPDQAAPKDRGQRSDFTAPTNEVEKILADIWCDILKLPQVGIQANFFQLGGDSILSIQMTARAHQAGISLPVNQIFQHPTIAGLAQLATLTTTTSKAEQGLVTGPVPLTPIQRRFFANPSPEPHHFNLSAMHLVPSDLSTEHLQEALKHLLIHHDALRLRFTMAQETATSGRWRQENAMPEACLPFEVVDLSDLSPQAQVEAISERATALQASLNLATGPLLRMVYFKLGTDRDHPSRLLTVVHHLVMDGVSWHILLEDLATAYGQLVQGQAVALPAKTTSFQTWATWLVEQGVERVLDDLSYWQKLSQELVKPLPVDHPRGSNTMSSRNKVATVAQVSVTLSKEDTQALLHEAAEAYNTQINDLLLTALLLTFQEWTGEASLQFDLEGHGREALTRAQETTFDLSRTVGWFTSIFPLRLTLPEDGLSTQIKGVKEQLRQIPHRGVSYGILRYLHPKAENLFAETTQSQVAFNYLGQIGQADATSDSDALIQGLATEDIGPLHSELTERPYLIHINGVVLAGQLQVDWLYSTAQYDQKSIETVANSYLKHLQVVIEHCLSPNAGSFTPSDFPEADLSEDELEDLLSEIE